MIKGFKIRLLPTPEQEQKFYQTIGACRFIYNWGINQNKNSEGYLSSYTLQKQMTQLKKQENYIWLNNISTTALKMSLIDLDKAYKIFFKKQSKYPKFKSRKKSKKSFYARPEKLNFKFDTVNIEKCGRIKFKSHYDIDFKNYNIYNARVSYDNKYWYLSFTIDICENQTDIIHNDLSIGIDLGLKDFAICSTGDIFHGINKTFDMKKLDKRLKHLQCKLAKKYLRNGSYEKSNNIIKLEKQIALIYRKIHNKRLNYLYYVINQILKYNPSRIVIEDLNISGMMKNRHLSKAIQNQMFYKFSEILAYKCNWLNIDLVIADRFYPSSQLCSNCRHQQKMPLNVRTYKCPKCGLIIDRDLNAAINLSKID